MNLLDAAGFVFSWWGFSLLAALAVWPLVFLCLRRLPDRGLAFARIFGLLVVGYCFWLGCWLHLWPNSPGWIWLVLLAVSAAAWGPAWRMGDSPWVWLRSHWKEARFTEILFLAAFALWAFVRANNPDATASLGEKRMELAFLNSILRSTYFPPNDPWLSGYSISYYHFGYILTAMIAKATGLAGAVAHNLGSALWFALSAVGSFGLLRNLLRLRAGAHADPVGESVPTEIAAGLRQKTPAPLSFPPFSKRKWGNRGGRYLLFSLLAPFILLVVGNLEGFLEVLHADGIGWQGGQGQFWQWLGIPNLTDPPGLPLQPMPSRVDWWWQASRVLTDRSPSGNSQQLIDEFPAFSFLLGDLHPHILSLPFLLAALAVILEMLLRRGGAVEGGGVERWLFFGFLALSIGSLVFLNTWDILLFGLAAIAGWAGWRWSGRPLAFGPASGWRAYLLRWLLTGVLAFGLFLPFIIGFQSQAGGLIPNILFPTRGAQFLVMFLPLLIPVLGWMIFELASGRWRPDWKRGIGFTVGGPAAVLIGTIAVALIPSLYPDVGGLRVSQVLLAVLARRLSDPVATVVPLVLAVIALAVILGGPKPVKGAGDFEPEIPSPQTNARLTTIFVFLLGGWGAFLVLFPEYFYLRDISGTRVNTVFKFYFAAWTVWSLVAAYGMYCLVSAFFGCRLSSGVRASSIVVGMFSTIGLALGAVYLPLALWTKTNRFDPTGGRTLDASAFLFRELPADAEAIAWINLQIGDGGPIAEAVEPRGKAYTDFSRIATFTGIPDVLGWAGHEHQWRGSLNEVGTRQTDLEALFTSPDWETAQKILDEYGIRYVYFGPLESQTYGILGLEKFVENMKTIYQSDAVILFERYHE